MTTKEERDYEEDRAISCVAACYLDTVQAAGIYDEQFDILKSEAEVAKFAKKELEHIDWNWGLDDEDKIPLDFIEKNIKEIRKQFVDRMISDWGYWKVDKKKMEVKIMTEIERNFKMTTEEEKQIIKLFHQEHVKEIKAILEACDNDEDAINEIAHYICIESCHPVEEKKNERIASRKRELANLTQSANSKQFPFEVNSEKYFPKTTINKLLSKYPNLIKRCVMMSKTASSTGFTPWFQDEDGYWIGIVRWYGNNNKLFKIDYRDGNKKAWVYCRKMPILPKNHKIRVRLENLEKENKTI